MTVTLSRWKKAPYVFCDDLPESAVEALDDELSYAVPDARHTDAWKRGEWDGRERLLRETNGSHYFPEGCLTQAVRVLDSLGIDYTVEGIERPGRGDLPLSWNTDMELRPYQQDALDDALHQAHGIITMPTGSGKTLIGIRLAYELKRSTLVLVHRKEIAEQWVEQMEKIFGVDVARAFGGDAESGDIQVALYQTIYDDDEGEVRDDIRLDHDVLLADEAHRVGADTFSRVSLSVNAKYRYGFSATPEREDNATLKVIGGTGPLISDISPENLIEQGYLAEPQFCIETAPKAGGPYKNWQQEYKAEIVENHRRNQLIAKIVADLPKPTYVHVERIAHGERLEALIDDATFIYGDSTDRDEVMEAFRAGELPVLVSTLLGEGVDVPQMESMVMAGGLKTEVGAIQKVGRALRPDTDDAVIVDFVDQGRHVSDHSEQRIRKYQDYYGKYGP